MNSTVTQIMIDIETLGRKNDAAIREVGLIAFWEDGSIIDTLQLSVSPEVWNTCNRTFSGETILWLNTADSIASEFNCNSYKELVERINKFFHVHKESETRVWAKGHMDLEVLKDLYETLEEQVPWEFWQPRDLRTIQDLPVPRLNCTNKNHRAFEDALSQVKELCVALHALKTAFSSSTKP